KVLLLLSFFISSRRRHTRSKRDWSSDVCSSDLPAPMPAVCAAIFPMQFVAAASFAEFGIGAWNADRSSLSRAGPAGKTAPAAARSEERWVGEVGKYMG